MGYNRRLVLGEDVRFNRSTSRIYMNVIDLKHLPRDIFKNLVELTYLDLSENQISSLHSNNFLDLKELQTLYLHQNNIAKLPDGIFRKLSKLTELDLSHNQISSLEPNIFVGLKELETLLINWNNIADLPEGIFRDLSKLVDLLLSQNQITCLDSNIFVGLKELKNLDLSTNRLDYLMQDEFGELESLEDLDLRNNSLRWISGDMFVFWQENYGEEIFPTIDVRDNELTHLPRCLAQLENFKYTTNPSLNYTGKRQPNDTAVEDICDGTDQYTYPAYTCQELATILTTDGAQLKTTVLPDGPASKGETRFLQRYPYVSFYLFCWWILL